MYANKNERTTERINDFIQILYQKQIYQTSHYNIHTQPLIFIVSDTGVLILRNPRFALHFVCTQSKIKTTSPRCRHITVFLYLKRIRTAVQGFADFVAHAEIYGGKAVPIGSAWLSFRKPQVRHRLYAVAGNIRFIFRRSMQRYKIVKLQNFDPTLFPGITLFIITICKVTIEDIALQIISHRRKGAVHLSSEHGDTGARHRYLAMKAPCVRHYP